MKLLILLMSMTVASTPVTAQVITGGVMVGPQIAALRATQNIVSLEKHLVKQHGWCPSVGVKLQNENLMNLYLKLALFRSTRATTDACNQANIYLKCMNNQKTKELVKDLKANKMAKVILVARYKISESRVEQILNFFSKLDKKIE
jgi:hypothetical protein